MNPFILLSYQRTGSTYIRIWLHSHPQIRSHGEVFMPRYTQADGFRQHCLDNYALGRGVHSLLTSRLARKLKLARVPAGYVDDYLERFFNDPQFPGPWMYTRCDGVSGDAPKPWAGFKIMYDHLLTMPRLMERIERQQFAVLHLVRDNSLKQYVSLCRMKQNRVSHSLAGVNKPDPVQINVQKMLSHFKQLQRESEYFRSKYGSCPKYLEFSYEEFFAAPDAVAEKVTKLFGVDSLPMEAAKLQKTSTNEIEAEIANPQEVRDALRGTEYAYFLNDYR